MPTLTAMSNGSKPNISRLEYIALVAAIMALNALAIDIMLPALPNIGQALNIANENDRQLVISAYLLGVGAAQLLFGPLSDRFGRRKPLMISLIFYIITAFIAIFLPNFALLLLLRFLQGVGAASFRVIAMASVRDKYEGREMAQIMSLIFMVFMIIPIIAPSIGQLLLLFDDWHLLFLFIGTIGLIVAIWAFFRFPETLEEKNIRQFNIRTILEGFYIVISNRFSFSYALAGMFILGGLFGQLNSSQQIFVDIYGLGVFFPIAFAGVGIVMVIASFLNSRIVRHFGVRKIAHFALFIYMFASIIVCLLGIFNLAPFWLFYFLLALILFMFSWAAPNMNTLSMQPLGKVAGTAASTFGFIQTIGGALIGLFIGRFFDGTIVPLGAGLTLTGLLALIFALIGERGKLFGSSDDQ